MTGGLNANRNTNISKGMIEVGVTGFAYLLFIWPKYRLGMIYSWQRFYQIWVFLCSWSFQECIFSLWNTKITWSSLLEDVSSPVPLSTFENCGQIQLCINMSCTKDLIHNCCASLYHLVHWKCFSSDIRFSSKSK